MGKWLSVRGKKSSNGRMGKKITRENTVYLFIFIFLILFNVYSFLRERERQSWTRERADREGDPESEAGSRLRAVSTEPSMGLQFTNREIVT